MLASPSGKEGAMPRQENRRFFTEFHDSIRQREYAGEHPFYDVPKGYNDGYKGRLRFDSLLSQRLVVTDAQILDGSFFLAQRPDELSALFGRTVDGRPPLEIRSRAKTLNEALMRFVCAPGEERLNAFFFSSVATEATRITVAQELTNVHATDVGSPHAIAKVLGTLGATVTDTEALASAWTRWGASDAFSVVQWDDRAYNLDSAFAEEKFDANQITTETGQEWLRGIRSAKRSAVICSLPYRRASAAEDERSDVDAIWSWYNRAYNRASASQHKATFESLDPARKPASPLRQAYDGLTGNQQILNASDLCLQVPFAFVDMLAEMEDGLVASLVQASHGDLTDWWYLGDLDALKKALARFYRYEPQTRSGVPQSARVRLRWCVHSLGAIVGAGAAAGVAVAKGMDPHSAAEAGVIAGGSLGGALLSRTVWLLDSGERTKDRTERAIVECAKQRSSTRTV
jgi:hypothetical protein